MVLMPVVGLPLALLVYGYVAEPGWVGVAHKTLWDWMQLLIAPLALAGLGFFINNRLQKQHEDRQYMTQMDEEFMAKQRGQETALQEYIRQIVQLVSDSRLSNTEPGDPIRALARVLTLMTLEQLDGSHKHTVLRILYEMNLIAGDDGQPIVALDDADLREANLNGAELRYAGLRGVDLRKADLRGADLHGADLTNSNLQQTFFSEAGLSEEDLRFLLHWEYDSTTKQRTPVADLSDAKLDVADLSDAKVTEEQLSQCKSLKGATMPNGQKYEDWLKDREGRKEDEQDE